MPKITDLVEQKRNAKRMSIFIDDEYFAGASLYIVKKYKIEIGKEVDTSFLEDVIKEDNLEKAKEYTVNYLLGKTVKQIKDKLKSKEYDDTTIEDVVAFLEAYNLVDDLDFARRMTHDAVKLKNQGKKMIQQKLYQKGVPKEDIEKAINEINDEDEYRAAEKALEKKLTNFRIKAKSKYELKSKCFAYLASRGYDSDVVKLVIENLLKKEEG